MTRRAALAASGLLLCAPAAPGMAWAQEEVWVELASPSPAAVLDLPTPLVEVSGWAGAGVRVEQDLVLVIDLSGSTREPSGVDAVEGEDSVRAVSIEAARRLVDGLDFSRTRATVIVFADNAWALTPLTDRKAELEERLDELETHWKDFTGATNFAKALRKAGAVLAHAPARSEGARRRDVVLLSDGEPTAPPPLEMARSSALAAADELGSMGVRVQSFALGRQTDDALAVYAGMAERTGGRLVHLVAAAEVLHHLPRLDLAGVTLEVANATSGAPARATHLGADGSFDSFVPLVPGANQIRVTARGRQGGVRDVERTVSYAPRVARDAADAARMEEETRALLKRLELRTAQLDLLLDMQRRRAAPSQRRELEVEAERSEASEPAPAEQ